VQDSADEQPHLEQSIRASKTELPLSAGLAMAKPARRATTGMKNFILAEEDRVDGVDMMIDKDEWELFDKIHLPAPSFNLLYTHLPHPFQASRLQKQY